MVHPESSGAPQTELCRRVVDHLGADYAPTHIVLDSNDYTDDSTILDEFRDIAFSWTPDRPRERVPSYLLKVMSDPSCTHLVWLSRKALAYTEQLFVWVFAHELRHLYQSRHTFPRDCIRTRVRELRREPRFSTLPSSIFAPEEIDSELCGMRVTVAMFGAEQLQQALRSNPLPRYPSPAYASLLQEVEALCQA
jgi:hypothetical protein